MVASLLPWNFLRTSWQGATRRGLRFCFRSNGSPQRGRLLALLGDPAPNASVPAPNASVPAPAGWLRPQRLCPCPSRMAPPLPGGSAPNASGPAPAGWPRPCQPTDLAGRFPRWRAHWRRGLRTPEVMTGRCPGALWGGRADEGHGVRKAVVGGVDGTSLECAHPSRPRRPSDTPQLGSRVSSALRAARVCPFLCSGQRGQGGQARQG